MSDEKGRGRNGYRLERAIRKEDRRGKVRGERCITRENYRDRKKGSGKWTGGRDKSINQSKR